MRHKMAFQDLYCRFLYLFRPLIVIGTCFAFMTVADIIGILLLFRVQSAEAHDVILAIITGITASVIVAIIIEMANNYQRNNKRRLLLSRLFSTLLHYSSNLAIATGHFDSNRSHIDFTTKIHKNFVAQGKETEEEAQAAIERAATTFKDDDERDEDWKRDHDRVRRVSDCLPEIIPEIDKAYHSFDGVFKMKELTSMGAILWKYEQIKLSVQDEVMDRSTILYGVDPQDPGELVTWLPERVKCDLPDMSLLMLAQAEMKEELKKIAEAIVSAGASGLSSLGIEIGEDLIEDESDDEYFENTKDVSLGSILSTMISDIDHELINLQDIIKSEPGFGSFYSFMTQREEKYMR